MAQKKSALLARSRLQKFGDTVRRWLDSPAFFSVIVGLLVFQALWIALSARFPNAFDEDFHFGLIQLHAQQWLPFFTHQPPGAEVHGAVARDPSYLYHYLLSFPYRLVAALTSSLLVQVIVLRLLNLAMFVGGLYIFRAVLSRLGMSRRVVHTTLLFFVITPVVPQLAAQINYDNLILVLAGALFLYTLRYLEALQKQRRIVLGPLFAVVLYGMFAALVKYTSLPVTVALLALMTFLTLRELRRPSAGMPALQFAWPKRSIIVLTSVAFLLLGTLNLERYGINLVRYHSLSPDCAKVLSVRLCQSYAPWNRDYQWAHIYPHPSPLGILVYPLVWLHRMVFETMFTISSRFGYLGLVEYVPAPPLTVANYTAWTLVVTSLFSIVIFARRLWQQPYLRYLLLVTAFYTAVLFAKNFSQYLHSGEAVAIHGRYMVPLYPLVYAAGVLALGYLFERVRRPGLKVWLVVVSLVFLTQGAGLIVWIFRSDPSWYWSRGTHDLVYQINRPVQTVIHRIIIP